MEQVKELTFSDLRVHFRTGRSYVISGTGKDRKYGYRTGVKCDVGDLEISEWRREVRALIKRTGEERLFEQLHEFMKQHNYCRSSKSELEDEALELHASRIFDNEAWVLFIEFNRLYRPELLKKTPLRLVKTDCCGKPGWVTQKRINAGNGEQGTVPCPTCGKWSAFEFVALEEGTACV